MFHNLQYIWKVQTSLSWILTEVIFFPCSLYVDCVGFSVAPYISVAPYTSSTIVDDELPCGSWWHSCLYTWMDTWHTQRNSLLYDHEYVSSGCPLLWLSKDSMGTKMAFRLCVCACGFLSLWLHLYCMDSGGTYAS